MDAININQKLQSFSDYYNPRIIAELNGQLIKLVKFKGDFVWHFHENEDEMFMVIKGKFKMEFRNKSVEIKEGDIIVVPKGIEHRPVAEEEVHVMLFEPATTLNTGNNSESVMTKRNLERI